ncbi:5,10-methylene tetrahydromethanopterin reductase [Enemella evansiae]|uniref:5,10-methylene tetrahydromethanopterin reductase n=1 Tax=Enemella evansiae TaxID=2016499 RepID=A0A255GGK0_9ACTN|nr:LLM class flavin-dependent oxidoreductase [Enemella evansiae]OYO14542.1 5,10-methylene tetrahydromethanopterin reductase [Enemella evansiae]
MVDYFQEIEFGIFPTPSADNVERLVGLAELADAVGIDLITIQDHPYQGKFVDTWTLLSVIGARTSQLRLSPNVASLPLRPPVMLGKAAATLDLLTAGRVELGLGAGAFWDAIEAAGGPRRTPGEAVDALAEAIEILRGMWRGESLRFDGEHYQVRGLHAGPVPAHEIPIWIGSYKPRMLRLTGRLADGWVPSMGYADPPALPELSSILDEAALKAGRSPGSIKRIYNVFGKFGRGGGFLQGTPADWAEQLAELALTTGMSTFVVGTDDPDTVRVVATEVAPAVRELVAAERANPTSRPESEAEQEKIASAQPTSTSTGKLRVTPTPDDGVRLSTTLPWDEATRPTRPAEDQSGFTDAQLAVPQHLIDMHDGLRAELAQVRDIVDQVRTGHLSVGQARSVINTMTMRQNNWTLGAFCESYCRIVTGHHTLEDRSIFPHLRHSEPDLAPVLDRLKEEHEVIHEVLDALDRALVGLVDVEGYGAKGRDALDRLGEQIDLLTDTLLSHLAYEERELLAPLARYGFQ